MDQRQETTVKWLSGLTILLGVWLVISPFAYDIASTSVYWNQMIVGVLAIVLGFTQLSSPQNSWPSWINLLAAIWLIVSPYVFNPVESFAYTNAVITGILLGLLAFADGLAASGPVTPTTTSGSRPI